MRVVFLDYDGVLNSPFYLINRTLQHKQKGTLIEHYKDDFDPKRIKILKKICDQNNAKVVVTSSWRENEQAIEYLKEQGIPIIGKTERTISGHRGREIEMWLQGKDVEDFVILDDEVSDIQESLMEKLVCTREAFSISLIKDSDYYIGLQPKHIKMVEGMFK